MNGLMIFYLLSYVACFVLSAFASEYDQENDTDAAHGMLLSVFPGANFAMALLCIYFIVRGLVKRKRSHP